MIERYIIRLGKYGAYLYDINEKKSLSLQDTVNTLNGLYNRLKKDG